MYLKGFFIGLVGIIIGIVISIVFMYKGAKVEIGFEYPWFKADFVGAPHQIPINFGKKPSKWTLGQALQIVSDRTLGSASARVYLDPNVISGELASKIVQAPAGYQPSLQIIHQLLADAGVSDKIQVCLVPEGGYRVCQK